jgi:thiol:disulfide interchange protein DsbD
VNCREIDLSRSNGWRWPVASFAGALACLPLALLIIGAQALAAARSAGVVSIESIALRPPLAAGGSATLEVEARILAGWHINSNRPLAGYYIPTRFTLTPPAGVRVGTVTYPPAREVSLKFAGREKLCVFTGPIEFKLPLVAAPGFRRDVGAPATVRIDYQACNDDQCLRPAFVSSTIDLASAQAAGSTADSDSLAAMESSDNDLGGDTWLTVTFARHGYLLGFLVVLLGGLALNLTPCVYPLIGVTVAYFGNEGGLHRRLISRALVYALGIALMFSAVGVAVALTGGLFGAALQNRWVLSGIAAMLLALAASSFGLFTLQPPQWMMRRAAIVRPGYVGALVMGLGMGVVAAPCIGPIVLGLLLMVQRSGSALFGFALFFTLAIGLGIPYVALAAAAGSIRRLPRSGEWLRWIEQLFGFVLVGLALYFLDPVIPGRLMTRILPFYAVAVGLFLGFVSAEGRNWQPFFVFKSALGLAATVGLVFLLIAGRPRGVELTFQPFSPATLETARARRKPVVLDFSADWCVPCREMERTTFIDPAVIRQGSGFVRMRANLTAENPYNQALMKQFNIHGVPTTVFIDSGGRIRKRRVGYVGPSEFLKYLREYD